MSLDETSTAGTVPLSEGEITHLTAKVPGLSKC